MIQKLSCAFGALVILVGCTRANLDLGGAVGSITCDEPDGAQPANQTSTEAGCAPAPCSIVGAFQPGGGEVHCEPASSNCSEVIPTCTEGAIRFDSSGALSRLTSAGWESACSYAVCGDKIFGAQLSRIFDDNAQRASSTAGCGPDFAVSIGTSGPGDAGITICELHGFATCSATAPPNNGGDRPQSVEVAYSRCAP